MHVCCCCCCCVVLCRVVVQDIDITMVMTNTPRSAEVAAAHADNIAIQCASTPAAAAAAAAAAAVLYHIVT
jgi:alkanesulfonate monooxygenase SsuD/methylene tetrahydromethanopterin reductase-like flavin-dependent oxidoreductase (luciferase family)